MNNRAIGIAGLVMTLLGLVATICIFAFEARLRKTGWIDLDIAALGSACICVVGCILGMVSHKTSEGKVATVLGCLLILFFVYLFCAEGASPDTYKLEPALKPNSNPDSVDLPKQ